MLLKLAATGVLLNVQIITLLFYSYCTEVHLSFCDYMYENISAYISGGGGCVGWEGGGRGERKRHGVLKSIFEFVM